MDWCHFQEILELQEKWQVSVISSPCLCVMVLCQVRVKCYSRQVRLDTDRIQLLGSLHYVHVLRHNMVTTVGGGPFAYPC